jgi:uncharacterized membrane protein YedE/YeeE
MDMKKIIIAVVVVAAVVIGLGCGLSGKCTGPSPAPTVGASS